MYSDHKTRFYLSRLRTGFTILLYTLISWLANRGRAKKSIPKILGTIPSGFKHMGFQRRAPLYLTLSCPLNPSQKLIAIGITNIFGRLFGG
ncbi:unnamed protein product [Tuber aestivum]|uniref:Uncharacterized protein n=1 Tax=Tuber aestivum TaxID=59557 RepID=A0A292Q8Z5_9PEZI|nr:unnamed protein product [Tuber aestivum]